jgi:glycosyltransferase involved in cell wall biosynthesis
MRVLLTNNTLGARAGTEMYLCDVARELKRLGHEPAAYSPCLGVVADLLRAAGIPVVADLALLPFRPEVIHGHHHIETITALASLPGVPAIYFCHGAKPWHEMPPVFPRILRYVAVDQVCRERILRETGAPEERVRMILNFVDTDVFKPRQPLPARPARALVFSNYATEANYLAPVRAACAQCGIELEVRGEAAGNPTDAPQDLLPQYDLVFAKARAAIEAMAVGCAVVLCDGAGLGPMVSTGNLAELRPNNFGLRTLRNPPTVENIAAAIEAYDASDAAGVRDLVRTQADVRASVGEIVRLYGEVVAENAERPADATAELRAAGAYLQTLDTIIKYGELKEALVLPAVGPPDAIALPPPVKTSWLRRLLGMEKRQTRAGSPAPSRAVRG